MARIGLEHPLGLPSGYIAPSELGSSLIPPLHFTLSLSLSTYYVQQVKQETGTILDERRQYHKPHITRTRFLTEGYIIVSKEKKTEYPVR